MCAPFVYNFCVQLLFDFVCVFYRTFVRSFCVWLLCITFMCNFCVQLLCAAFVYNFCLFLCTTCFESGVWTELTPPVGQQAVPVGKSDFGLMFFWMKIQRNNLLFLIFTGKKINFFGFAWQNWILVDAPSLCRTFCGRKSM